jgi:hypothetical protein
MINDKSGTGCALMLWMKQLPVTQIAVKHPAVKPAAGRQG